MTSSGAIGRVWHGPMARGCALALHTLGRLDEALRWQERALELSRQLSSPPLEAIDRLGLADLLAAAGDEASARDHRAAAMRLIEAHGLAGLLPPAERAASGGRVAGAREAPRPVTRFSLEREGDAWRLDCDGETFHLKDLRGLHILAALLARTGTEIHVIDLAGGGEAVADGGDSGELLDRRARDEYRQRLSELESELADADQSRDLGRATRARAELEFLEAELARAVGMGGRARRAGSAVERARVNIQRRLREAIRRISLHSPRLGRHLENAVHTGTYCRYAPE
jgi:tetratricopeptide (TPR) repeat protein